MKSCERIAALIVDQRYGLIDDPEQARALREHLDSCRACAAQSEVLGLLASSLRVDEAFPQEATVDWDAFSRRTVARAMTPFPEAAVSEGARRRAAGWRARAEGWRGLVDALSRPMTVSFTPAWAAAAVLVVSALALTAYGLLPSRSQQLGGTVPIAGRPPGQDLPGQDDSPDHAMVPDENLDMLTVTLARRNTAQYLRDTRAVLITLLDVEVGCDKDSVDITAERARALELLRRQRLVATELGRVPLARAKDVTEDLQQLLLEISSLADCTPSGDIQTLRDVVEKKQILVRMELLSQELARRGATRA